MPDTIWTIGHSNRSLDEFLGLLTTWSIALVADVRKLAGSRRHPHFNQDELKASLAAVEIGYKHFPELGGRRSKRTSNSANNAWRVDAFNAFADYMATTEFHAVLDELMTTARSQRTVIMCSEAVPWQCHRRLIADALVVRGWSVQNIMSLKRLDPHTLTDFARIEGLEITYPADPLFS